MFTGLRNAISGTDKTEAKSNVKDTLVGCSTEVLALLTAPHLIKLYDYLGQLNTADQEAIVDEVVSENDALNKTEVDLRLTTLKSLGKDAAFGLGKFEIKKQKEQDSSSTPSTLAPLANEIARAQQAAAAQAETAEQSRIKFGL